MIAECAEACSLQGFPIMAMKPIMPRQSQGNQILLLEHPCSYIKDPSKGISVHVSAPSLALCTNCEGSFPLTSDVHIKITESPNRRALYVFKGGSTLMNINRRGIPFFLFF